MSLGGDLMLPYGRQSIAEDDVAGGDRGAARRLADHRPRGRPRSRRELAGWTGGVPCVAVTSGTAALHVAYAAAGVGPGDEVITSPLTFVATAARRAARRPVVFADVEADTGQPRPGAAEAAVDRPDRVITARRLRGPSRRLRRAAGGRRPGRRGADRRRRALHRLGLQGPAGGRARRPHHVLLLPDQDRDHGRGRRGRGGGPRRFAGGPLRNHGLVRDPAEQRDPDERRLAPGGARLRPQLPAARRALRPRALSQLRRLAGFRARRAELVARYNALLAGLPGLTLPAQRTYTAPSWHLYPLRIGDGRRREVYERMRAAGIGVQVNYLPAYWHPVFEDLGYRRGLCPAAEAYYAEQLSLPLFPDLTDAEQGWVVDRPPA